MKTLIITAHPSSLGFTHKIAQTLKTQKESQGIDVEILDLYKSDIHQGFLNFEDKKELKEFNPLREKMQEKLKSSGEYVFIFPLWWMNMPAIMKNFLDNNISSPFAFHYENGKRMTHLNDKISRVYMTCDGPCWVYYLLGLPFLSSLFFGTFVFCGIRMENFFLFRMLNKSEEEKSCLLEKIKKNTNKRSILVSVLNFIFLRR